jgi:hypothetical protein
VHYSPASRDRWQGLVELHGVFGGVALARLSFGFFFCPCLLRCGCGAREQVVRARDVGLWRVASVQGRLILRWITKFREQF